MDHYIGFIVMLYLASPIAGISNYYMDLNCGSTLNFQNNSKHAIRLRLTSRSSYRSNMNCLLTLSTTIDSRFMLYFKDFDIESSTSCKNDYLDVLDGNSTGSPYVGGINKGLCGSYMNKYVYVTSRNTMLLHFVSDGSRQYSGFDMVITSYHTGQCYASDYECNNGRCISNSLTCNGYNPCGDHSDCPLAAGAIAGIVIGSFFIIVIACTALIVCRRRRRRRYAGGHVQVVATSTPSYGTPGQGYNQPVPQQYPAYPTGQQYPPTQQYPQF